MMVHVGIMFTPAASGYTPSIPPSIQSNTLSNFDIDSIDAVLAQANEALRAADVEIQQYSTTSTSVAINSIVSVDLADLLQQTEHFLDNQTTEDKNNHHHNVVIVEEEGTTATKSVNAVNGQHNRNDRFKHTKKIGKWMIGGGRQLWTFVSTRLAPMVLRQVSRPGVVQRTAKQLSKVIKSKVEEWRKERQMYESNVGQRPLRSLQKTIDTLIQSCANISSLTGTTWNDGKEERCGSANSEKKKRTWPKLMPAFVPTKPLTSPPAFVPSSARKSPSSSSTKRFFFMEEKTKEGDHQETVTTTHYEASFAAASSSYMTVVAAGINEKSTWISFVSAHLIRYWQARTLPTAWVASVVEGCFGGKEWQGTTMIKAAKVPRVIGDSKEKKKSNQHQDKRQIPFFGTEILAAL